MFQRSHTLWNFNIKWTGLYLSVSAIQKVHSFHHFHSHHVCQFHHESRQKNYCFQNIERSMLEVPSHMRVSTSSSSPPAPPSSCSAWLSMVKREISVGCRCPSSCWRECWGSRNRMAKIVIMMGGRGLTMLTHKLMTSLETALSAQLARRSRQFLSLCYWLPHQYWDIHWIMCWYQGLDKGLISNSTEEIQNTFA